MRCVFGQEDKIIQRGDINKLAGMNAITGMIFDFSAGYPSAVFLCPKRKLFSIGLVQSRKWKLYFYSGMILYGFSLLSISLVIGYPPCPHFRQFKEFIEKEYPAPVIIGTYHITLLYVDLSKTNLLEV